MNIPLFVIKAKNIARAWEKSVIKTWQEGIKIKTEYDKEGDPPSRDCTMIIVIDEPLSEPRIHRAFPGSLEDLEIYRLEVIEGIHDEWIKPEEGKWSYTYHQRLFNYPQAENVKINQIEYIIKKLAETYYTRRAQAITWHPKLDLNSADPPCLQRIWLRLIYKNNKFYLNMHTYWRSRDAYKAAFMNIFAFTELQKLIADEIAKKIKKEVIPSQYIDISDSYHIYGAYYEEFKRFLELLNKRKFKDRTWTTKFAQPFFEEARKKVKNLEV